VVDRPVLPAEPVPGTAAMMESSNHHTTELQEVAPMAVIDGRIKPEVEKLWRRYYPDYDPYSFGLLVEEYISPSSHVLEIGAGSGAGQQKHFRLKGKVARYVGIDLDEQVLANSHLDEAVVCDAQDLPFDDASFDILFHSMVAEHLQDPLAAIRETARVLKPGGTLLFETPNRFYYPMLVASMTPHRFHALYVEKFASGRASHEVFPTVYRLNDTRAIMAATSAVGLQAEIGYQSTPPGYLRFSRISFLIGVFYERSLERVFPRLRGRIIVVATKPAEPRQPSSTFSSERAPELSQPDVH
jgi:SAM-dependent methyltransferase